jgi:ribosomal protein S18 acetylase RimI-like enzyme
MTISIDTFSPADTDRCIDIRIQNYQEINNTPEKIAWVRDYFLSSLKDRNYFVAKEENTIVWMWAYKDNHIYSVFVDPKYHGKWVGKQLMQTLESEIKKYNYTDIVLNSSVYGQAFYEHLGFHVEGIQNDDIVMKKNI